MNALQGRQQVSGSDGNGQATWVCNFGLADSWTLPLTHRNVGMSLDGGTLARHCEGMPIKIFGAYLTAN